ncbi:MAG TPA: type IV pilus secretin PilQ, partial [Rhodocyclaceae bacterium]|nr:type IV pilus secretin PilQ [Rhodocyclaceae bacterium]
MYKFLLCIALGLGLSAASLALAQSSAPVASPADAGAKNSIESMQASQVSGSVIVKVTFKRPFEGQLGSFSVSNPARVAIDFPATENGL